MLTLEKARQWYPEVDAVHGFDHIERVYDLCRRIGQQEGADMEILLAAALLHDSQGSHPGKGQRNDHHLRSAEFAAEVLAGEGWDNARIQAVQHCIRAHRYRRGEEAPETLEAKILFDADKLDVLGAIGAIRTISFVIQAKQPIFVEPSNIFLSSSTLEDKEQYSAYHEYLYKLNKISKTLFTPTAHKIANHRQRFLNFFFEELAAEMRGER